MGSLSILHKRYRTTTERERERTQYHINKDKKEGGHEDMKKLKNGTHKPKMYVNQITRNEESTRRRERE